MKMSINTTVTHFDFSRPMILLSKFENLYGNIELTMKIKKNSRYVRAFPINQGR